MKRILALLLVLLLSCPALSALAEEPVVLNMTLITNGNYNHSDPDRDMAIWEAIEKACNVKLNITWITSAGQAEKVSTWLAEDNLPDMFNPNDAATLADEGAIMALDPYFDRISNYIEKLPDAVLAAKRNLEDGNLYVINMLNAYKPAYTMTYRQDWLDRLGVEKVPETLDEWIEVWKLIRDNDANGNGDSSDEVPFTSTTTFLSKPGYDLLLAYGVKTDGRSYYTDEGEYGIVFENEHFREFLELMIMLYSEKLIDQEVFTRSYNENATLYNSNIAFSGYQWSSNCSVVNLGLAETVPEAALLATVPVKGPYGDQLIPERSVAGSNFVISYKVEQDAEKLDAMLRLINYMYSEEGIELTNWGIEGVHYTVVDGEKWLRDDIRNDSSFTAARHAGLVCQQFPTYWYNYDQIMTNGMSEEEMTFATKSMYQGMVINWPYYYTKPATLATPAWVQYSADIFTKIDELFANCVTGKISIDDFYAGYEALKPFGLQEIIDQAQEYYTELTK